MSFSELAIKISAIDRASGTLAAISKKVSGLGAAAKASAAGMAIAGAGIAAVGVGIGYALLRTVQSASAISEQVHRLATVVPEGVAGLNELAMAQKAAAAYSMEHAVSQTEVLKSLYLGKSAGFSMATSIASMNTASALAIGLGGDLEATQRAVNMAFINFRDPLKSADQNFRALGDTMAYATRQFDYSGIEELRAQMQLATPTALAAGMGTPQGMKDMITVLADFSKHGLTGSLAGAAFEESLHGVLKMSSSLGIALVHNKEGGLDYMKSLEGIRTHFISLYGSMQAIPTGVLQQIQKTFGLRGIRALLLDPAEMEGMRAQLNNVAGAAANAQKIMESTPAQQWTILKNKLEALSITIGAALLPSAISLMGALGSVVERIVKFAQAHPALVKFVAVFAAISAGVLVVVGGLLVLAGAVASGVAAFAALGVTGPIIAGIIAIGLAIAAVVAAVAAFAPQFFKAGYNIAKSIAAGILSGIEHPLAAIGKVVKMIRDHLPFSPAKLGPLKDLGHIRISETIAAAIRPAPVMRAMGTVAAGIAMTGAMMGTPAYAGSSAASISIDARTSITVEGAILDSAGFERILEQHQHKITNIMEKELAKRGRTDF